MATNVLMPKWGMSMQKGLVACWLKKEGDAVEQGEEIVEVESDKAINLVEAPASGVLARILVPEGETVPITTVIAIIAAPGEEISESMIAEVQQSEAPPAEQSPAEQSCAESVPSAKPSSPRAAGRRVAASPAAKRLAREHHVELSEIEGTGPDGMIVLEDVQSALKAPPRSNASPRSKVTFFSQGHKLDGILYLPKESPADRLLPGIVFCLGFTYVKDLLVPEMARQLSEQGYACLVFDYRGFGASEGPRGRLLPTEQVTDIRSAVTFLAERPEVDANRVGLVGISLGGSHAVYTAGLDPHVQAAAAIAPMGDGRRWLRGSRRYGEWVEFLDKIEADRKARVLGGEQTKVDAWDIVIPDEASRSFLEALYREYPEIKCDLSLETAEALIDYSPQSMVGRIAPRPLLIIHGQDDLMVPLDESRSLFAEAGEPRELEIVPGMGHFDWAVPNDKRFDHVMQVLSRWLGEHLRDETGASCFRNP